jgi:hypothetical protein
VIYLGSFKIKKKNGVYTIRNGMSICPRKTNKPLNQWEIDSELTKRHYQSCKGIRMKNK